MLEKNIFRVFDKLKFQFYRRIFDTVREREGSLSAMEAFSLEIISMLNAPTVSQFADFLNISQSNATYKVNSLIRKGYIIRENSDTDRREYHLVLSEKFYRYMSLLTSYEDLVYERMLQRFSPAELETFSRMMSVISDELMPECSGMQTKDASLHPSQEENMT